MEDPAEQIKVFKVALALASRAPSILFRLSKTSGRHPTEVAIRCFLHGVSSNRQTAGILLDGLKADHEPSAIVKRISQAIDASAQIQQIQKQKTAAPAEGN